MPQGCVPVTYSLNHFLGANGKHACEQAANVSDTVQQCSFGCSIRISQQARAAVLLHPASAAGHKGRTKKAAGSAAHHCSTYILPSLDHLVSKVNPPPPMKHEHNFHPLRFRHLKQSLHPTKSFMKDINKFLLLAPASTCL